MTIKSKLLNEIALLSITNDDKKEIMNERELLSITNDDEK